MDVREAVYDSLERCSILHICINEVPNFTWETSYKSIVVNYIQV